ncbi:MAG: hypothetical protein ACK5NK_03880 [Niabella sp.]
MQQVFFLYWFFGIILFSVGCKTDTKAINQNNLLEPTAVDSLHIDGFDSATGFLETDSAGKDFPALNDIQIIRDNFKKINAITQWSSITVKEIFESAEGGEALYYTLDGNLEKIVTRNLGETFQLYTEYYLLNKQPSFVYEKRYTYNRPIYYDSVAMKELGDSEIFDFDKSIITEKRNYFKNNKLLRQVNNPEIVQPDDVNLLQEEEQRILTAYKTLLTIIK